MTTETWRYYLDVSHPFDGTFFDEQIERVLGDEFERVGSGASAHRRDIEFSFDRQLDQEAVNALQLKLRLEAGHGDITVVYNEWLSNAPGVLHPDGPAVTITAEDPNEPEAIRIRKAELEANKHKAMAEICDMLATHDLRVASFDIDRTPDCSPRFEAMIYPVYIGIWLYQDGDEKRFAVEIDEALSQGWLEDGVERGATVQHASFRNFKDAMAAVNTVIDHLSSFSHFDSI